MVLLAGVLLVESFVWLMMRRELSAGLDRTVLSRAAGIEEYLKIEMSENAGPLIGELTEIAGSLPPDYIMEFRDSGGSLLYLSRKNPGPLRGLPTDAGRGDRWLDVAGSGVRYRVLQHPATIEGRRYLIGLAVSTDQISSVLATLSTLSLIAIPIVVLFAAAGGYWLSTRALAPVDALARAARSMSIDNLSERLPVAPSGDEIARLASTWNDMLARLESSVRRIVEFTSDASHELRTPVAFIRSSAEIALRRTRSESEYRAALRNIELESERMTRLVEDLLFLARADAQVPGLRVRPLDLQAAVNDACSEIAPLAEIKQVHVVVTTALNELTVAGDESALRRMVLVLLDNAVKYSPPGGSVAVLTERVNGHARICVSDNGIGISPDALPHIFERFYRADPARARDSGGYGLGLSIAQTIARQHLGEIAVESAPDMGSTFRVSVPLSA